VVLFTQTANARSMRLAAKLGFTEVERYEAYGAEQWFGMWSPVALLGKTPNRPLAQALRAYARLAVLGNAPVSRLAGG
jgi:RimJ/RimL family protein N-acetyltransferase